MLDAQVPPSPLSVAAPVESGERAPRRQLLIMLLVGGYLANVILRVWLSNRISLPVAHTDEDSYLNTARVFAGGPGGFSSENNLLRRVGYAWLISPAFLGDHSFGTSYARVHVLNAIYNSTIFPLAYLFARSALRLPWRRSFLLALAVAVMPSTVFWSELAMTDVVLAPLTVAWVLLIVLWLRRPAGLWWSAGAAAVAGFYYMIHIRGVVILAVHLALVLAVTIARRIKFRALAVAAVTAVAFIGAHQLLVRSLGDKLYLSGDANVAASTARELSSGTLAKTMITIVGSQLWYISVATFGLIMIGWLFAVRIMRSRTEEPPLRWAMAAGLSATAGVVVGCALLLSTTPSATSDLVYARYAEAFAPLWTLVGIGGLLTVGRITARWWGLVTMGFMVVAGLSVQLRLDRAEAGGRKLRHGLFSAPELLATERFGLLDPLVFTALLLAVGVVVFLLMRGMPAHWSGRVRPWAAGLAVMLVVNVVLLLSLRWGVGLQVERVTPTPTLAALGVHEGAQVYATRNAPRILMLNLAHNVTWDDVPIIDNDARPPADAEYMIALWNPTGNTWNGEQYGYRYVGGNVEQKWALWRR
ncbi:MAG: hypothetical protein HOU81_14870 [Hamadaea sp.]|uniref:hypothetical protein n=1 Tax=Hamadaea sp. TaxID=2024425 RepID=UPI00181D8D1C|nr:hypothetical protein [Hamadaea sp.]NUR72095.1 hypothetical protein [Hamadaea sp.]NUT22817.1 hypothetical protein [Hamadaea sp.]